MHYRPSMRSMEALEVTPVTGLSDFKTVSLKLLFVIVKTDIVKLLSRNSMHPNRGDNSSEIIIVPTVFQSVIQRGVQSDMMPSWKTGCNP